MTTCLVLACTLLSLSNNVHGKELKQKIGTAHKTTLKKISQYSDGELVEMAKLINEDSIPGELSYSEILLTEAIRKNPKNVDALFELSKVAEKEEGNEKKKLQKSFEFIYQAFLVDQYSPKIRYKLASLFLELKQKELFQGLYQNTLIQYPDHIETKIEKIKLFAQTKPQLAIKISEDVLQSGGNIHDFLPYFILSLHQYDSEEKFSNNLKYYAERYPDRWLWYHLGIEYMAEKKYDKARDAFKNSIKLGNTIVARLQLAAAQYQNQSDIEGAMTNLELVIVELKKRPYIANSIVYFTHTQLACALMFSTQKNKLKHELNFLAEYSYNNQKYFISTMNEFLKHNKENAIESTLRQAIKKDPLFTYPYLALSKVLRKQKKYKQATIMHKKLILIQNQIKQ